MTDRDGVDVASFQGQPGQWKGEAGDIGWAAVKITELGTDGSRYVNPDAKADLEYLASAGKKRIFYLFAHPATSPSETASFFTSTSRDLMIRDDDMIAVDLEVTDGKPPAEVAKYAQDVVYWLGHDLGRPVIVYTYQDFAKQGNCGGLSHTPLWIAEPSLPAGHPVPVPPWSWVAIQQYQTGGVIDRDITMYKSAADMALHLGVPHAQQTPDPAPPKPKPVRKAVKKAASGTATVVKKEPVVSSSTAAGGLAAAVALLAKHVGWHLSVTEISAILTALPAVAALFSALKTKPSSVPVLSGALTTIATAAAAFGLKVSPQDLAIFVPFVTMTSGLLTSLRVSPSQPAAAPPAAGSS